MIISPKINSFLIQIQQQSSQQINYKNSSPSLTHETNLQSMINTLNKKIDKKDQLIRYLERKIGDQVIKSTRKLYVQIDKLESQNRQLKQEVEMFELNKKYQNLSQSMKQSYVVTNTPRKESGKKTLQIYRQEILKFTVDELRQLVIRQANQLQKLRMQNQFNLTSNKKNTEKQKKFLQSSIKKQPLTQRDHSLRDSNQNLNHANIALKDSTLNLNINTNMNGSVLTRSISKKQIPPLILKNNIQIQTQTTILQEIQIQTKLSSSDIQKLQININQLTLQNIIIKKQLQKIMQQNRGLRQQALYFAERIQDYCKQIENGQLQFDNRISLQLQKHNMVNEEYKEQKQNTVDYHIIQNYKQILQIFGIDWHTYPHLNTYSSVNTNFTGIIDVQQDKLHQKLLHQICNMKMQITQLLKQYRKLQKQLNQVHEKSNNMQNHIKCQQDLIIRSQQYCIRLTDMITDLNQQLMELRNKQLYFRYKQKSKYFNTFNNNNNCQIYDIGIQQGQLLITQLQQLSSQTQGQVQVQVQVQNKLNKKTSSQLISQQTRMDSIVQLNATDQIMEQDILEKDNINILDNAY